jgi:hypothetical protein
MIQGSVWYLLIVRSDVRLIQSLTPIFAFRQDTVRISKIVSFDPIADHDDGLTSL